VEATAQKVLAVGGEYLSPVAADGRPPQTKKSAALSPTQLRTKTATLADLYTTLAAAKPKRARTARN